MSTGPMWATTAGFLITATELVVTSVPVVANGTNVSYKLISGNLPTGMSVSTTGIISGAPSAVIQKTNYKFVVRATSTQGVSDRSFNVDVTGAQEPTWSTASGYTSTLDYNTATAYLKLGPTGEKFTLNRQWVNYQLSATPTLAPNSTEIRFFIPENGGELPPGILLNQEGVLSGLLTDSLIFDGSESDTGGYDEEAYDGYTYDHGAVAFDSIGVPKIYQFKVTASDGVSAADRLFKILIVSPDMIRNTDQIQMNLEPGLITSNTNYLPPLQFINGTDLGVARAENNETFDVSAYNGYPLLGNITYSITEGNTRLSQMPDFLTLDASQGIIYGYIPYQPAYTQNYQLTVNATRTYSTAVVTATNTFTLAIRGAVESSIEWVSPSSLGSIFAGEPSELAVVARQINSEYSIKYTQTSGIIPPGLRLERDGSLSGSVSYGNTGTFTFGVRAEDVHELSAIEREFTLTVNSYDNKKYTRAWIRPFMTLDKRATFRDFMIDTFTFPQSSMYRYFDPNFGVQTEIKMVLEFGIEQQNLADYVPALRENFYRRRFYFGDLKVAVAKTSTGTVIYEVVYVDIVDNMKQLNTGTNLGSVSRTLYTNNNIYYPSSVDNMRYQLENLILNDNDFITTDEYNMPLFMRTAQADDYRPAGYMHVLPLCYVLPGEGQKIISRIKLSSFDFKQFDMDIDRLILDNTLDNSTAKYLLFPRQTITDGIEADTILYGVDETPLETDQDDPINRE
jgi:hypothetical protein